MEDPVRAVLELWWRTPGNRRDAAWWKREHVLREDAFIALFGAVNPGESDENA